MERSAMDFVQFALVFGGFVTAAAGVVTSSVSASCTGLFLMVIGLSYFSLKKRDEE